MKEIIFQLMVSTGEVIAGKLETKPSEVIQVLISKTLDPKDSSVYPDLFKS